LTDNPQESDSQNLQDAQNSLDQAVAIAYGMDFQINPLEFLLNLNLKVSEKEIKGEKVIAPGLPDFITNPASFISKDCIFI
ncbi:MAG: hypothetical protein ACRC6M_01805, partial [Microcystaceae cyanobacterium]